MCLCISIFAGIKDQLIQQTPLLSDNKILSLYAGYKDDDDENCILSDGIERLCDDLGYKPDDFAILVLAWQLDASQMCRFTKTEFVQGLRALGADNITDIRQSLERIVEKLKYDAAAFKNIYRFTFRFGLEPDNRIVLLDMAILLWRLVFTVQTPPILDRWLNYLEHHTNIRGVTKDTWNMFLNFAETCDINAYDDTEAWPSLFDDFVEYETDRANQNVTDTGDGDAAHANRNKNIDGNGNGSSIAASHL